MSAFIPTDFTKQAKDTKERLDKFFRIVAMEEALRIIEEMRSIVRQGEYFEKLVDKQAELLCIFETLPQYVDENYVEDSDGVRRAKGLITDFRPECEDKIEESLDKYEEYAEELRSIDAINAAIDVEFLEKINSIFCEYKSSTDHMTRLVKRLLRYNFGYESDYGQNDTTRLLILKQFISAFGCDCPEIGCKSLKKLFEEKYGSDVENIDDSIFELISQPQPQPEADTTGVLFSDDYVDSLTKLHGTIRIKSPLIHVTKDICSRLCDVMNADVLSEAATEGTATLLSECFKESSPYYKIGITDIKGYSELGSTEKQEELNEMLRKRYSSGYLLNTDFPYSVRLYTLTKVFGKEISVARNNKAEALLKTLYPESFLNPHRETGVKYPLSSVFDPQKITYVNIEEINDAKKYIKLTEKLENVLLTAQSEKKQRASVKKRYLAALGEQYEALTKEKAGRPITYADYPYIYRLMVIAEKYADVIIMSGKSTDLLLKACPEGTFVRLTSPKFLSDLLDAGALEKIKKATGEMLADDNDALKEFVENAEMNYVADKEKYTASLRKRVENRYNNASTKGSGSDFIKNRNALYMSRKKKARNYIMLEIANDLANAAFSSQGKTREYIYIFAIAFDIRPIENGHPQRICDIEKNLFWDYYNDNIINNLPQVAGFGDKSDVMIDGYGINYKNFAEIAFLWCLAQSDMTPKERLATAYEIISYCREHGKTKEKFAESKKEYKDLLTKRFREDFEYAKSLSKKQFIEYIIENLPCKSKNSGIMQMSGEQRTAADVVAKQEEKVNMLLERFEKAAPLSVVSEDALEEALAEDSLLIFFYEYSFLTNSKCHRCPKHSKSQFPNCSKYFEPFDITISERGRQNTIHFNNCGEYYSYFSAMNKDHLKKRFLRLKGKKFASPRERFEASFSRVNELCNENQEQLRLLLNRIKKRIQIETGEKIRFKDVSRSTVMAICFYQFVLINWLKRSSEMPTFFGNFEKFYDIFVNGDIFTMEFECTPDMYSDDYEDFDDYYDETVTETICYEGANKILEQAGYAPVNSKSIFDIYLIYIAYRDNFLPLYTDPLIEFSNKYHALYVQFEKLKKERKIGEK